MEYLKIKGLKKHFLKENGSIFNAVDNVNLTVRSGEICALLGPNGAGKTTTIRMICSTVTPSSGDAYVYGFHTQHQRYEAMEHLGVVLEGARNIYWPMSAWNNLLYFGRIKGKSDAFLKKQAQKLLEELQLWDLKDIPVSKFSRGMQQKVAIACALVSDPKVLLLDEPTLGLDVESTRQIKPWLKQLASVEKKAIILTTHQMEVADWLCDSVAIMQNGKLLTYKKAHEIRNLLPGSKWKIVVLGDCRNFEKFGWEVNFDGMRTELIKRYEHVPDPQTLLHEIGTHHLQLESIQRLDWQLEELFLMLTKKGLST